MPCCFHHSLFEADPYTGVFLTIGPPLTHPSIGCQNVGFFSILHRRTSIPMPSSLLDQHGPILLLWTRVLALSSPLHRRTCIRPFSHLLGQGGPASLSFPHCLAKTDPYPGVYRTP